MAVQVERAGVQHTEWVLVSPLHESVEDSSVIASSNPLSLEFDLVRGTTFVKGRKMGMGRRSYHELMSRRHTQG